MLVSVLGSGDSFNATHKQLQEVPDIPASAAEVILPENYISHLPAGVFSHLEHCIVLDLSFNTIQDIDPGAFKGLSSMEFFTLYNNDIEILPPGVFSPLEQCTLLNVSSNNIRKIQPGTFTGLRKLRELDLQHNRIATLEINAFGDLTHLQVLYLQDNMITHLPDYVFRPLVQCTELYLQHNHIADIQTQAFHGLYSLQKLNLLNNPINTLDSETLSVLPRPITLILSGSAEVNDPPWACDSLCWLKQEEMAGTIKWFDPESAGYFPKCHHGSWHNLHCSKHGKNCPVFLSPLHLPRILA